MYLENIIFDSRDPHRLGRFYTELLGAEPFTNEPEGIEARLWFGEHFFLDLGFPRVASPATTPPRLHLDLIGSDQHTEVVRHALDLGAAHVDIGQGDVPWTVLADPDDNAFCVMEQRDLYDSTSPIAALPLDSADPQRDARFWAEITGWVPCEGYAPASLRHPSGAGPLLEFCHEPEAKQGKNRLHLDVRSEADDVDALERVVGLGATKVDMESDELPWVVFTDPSGNEFCVLAPYRSLAGLD